MAIYEFEEKRPVIAATAFIHPQATVIGEVSIGERCYIGAGAIIRGDYGSISIGDGTNVQENAVLHTEPTTALEIQENVLIGHAAIVHGPGVARKGATIGMGAVVNASFDLGEHSMLAAGSLLPPRREIPACKLAMGNPARVSKEIPEQQQTINRISVEFYQELAGRCQQSLKRLDK
ncbi:MAG TPA: gamma carbonic anhydrase family protein [Syntrophomonadaceae bacterium]|nr:gamma carbonic anhydrase family protein [Syntrophomonadaceae bacterium]